jgi:5'-nucleotidase
VNDQRPQILLTNDDGIRSPGLWAAAEALARVGYVTVVAPREQWTGAGRSMPITSDGSIREEHVTVGGKTWTVYAVGGTPAQAVQHAVLEVTPRRPDLLVAGINYGENVTVGVTMSGTVGAAMEGASFGIPSLAISLQTDSSFFHSHSEEIDFQVAAHFAAFFGRLLLNLPRIPDVDLLKVDVPADATTATSWKVSRLSRTQYYHPVAPDRSAPGGTQRVGYHVAVEHAGLEPDSDVHVLRLDGCVSVTPISLDTTSRVDLAALEGRIRSAAG